MYVLCDSISDLCCMYLESCGCKVYTLFTVNHKKRPVLKSGSEPSSGPNREGFTATTRIPDVWVPECESSA